MKQQRPHEQHWPDRLPRSITVPESSLWHNLRTSAERYPHKPALVFFDRTTSYGELAAQAEALAGTLHELGVRRGDRVLLDMQNCPQLVAAHFAILRANAVVVPVNPMNRRDELTHVIADSEAKVAITTADLAGELAAASNSLPPGQRLAHLLITQFTDALPPRLEGEEAPPPAWRDWLQKTHPIPELAGGRTMAWTDALAMGAAAPEHVVGAADVALLPYTSGTTGLPKGCVHAHASLMHNTIGFQLWTFTSSDSVALAVVPMFHITGIVCVLHPAIYAGATLILMPRWDRELAARTIARRGVTTWTNVPTMVVDLLAGDGQPDLGSLAYIGGGGAAMPQAIAQRLLDACGLRYVEGYGLTETAAPSLLNPFARPKQQCLGIPFIGTDARVLDLETMREAAIGESGEIVISGPGLFRGYWRQPEATQAAFIELDGKRFFRSGDIGCMDEDGYFFLTDRLKRMINASGFKVWPAEVELLMYQNPAIQEACVIATRDAYRGESVKAVVVLRPTHRDTTEQQVMQWCRERMSAYKVPRQVAFVEALPKSASGKILWRLLQEAQDAS